MIVLPRIDTFPSVEPKSFKYRRSKELLIAIKDYPGIDRPFYCSKSETYEVLVLHMEVNVPNNPINDIRAVEEIALVISEDPDQLPMVLALRDNFPTRLSHINAHSTLHPVYLCIYEEHSTEKMLNWTAIRFLFDIQNWLELTAKGLLHQEDQPLEPFLIGSRIAIIDQAGRMAPECLVETEEGIGYICPESTREKMPEQFIKNTVHLVSKSFDQIHNIVNIAPSTLGDLRNIFVKTPFDLQIFFEELLEEGIAERDSKLFHTEIGLFLTVDLQRSSDQKAEYPSSSVIKFKATLGSILKTGGALSFNDGYYVKNLQSRFNIDLCDNIPVEVLNPHFNFDYLIAGLLDGKQGMDITPNVLIGVGALGSQFLNNITRQGHGKWLVIEKDLLLPHNLARHELDQRFVGKNKGEALQSHINSEVFPNQEIIEAIDRDVLHLEDEERERLLKAALIIDISTSVAVERYLASRFQEIKKISAFLNPRGDQLVVLEEDNQGNNTLDLLEFQYYKWLLEDENLQDHFVIESTSTIRYARGCRDISSRISQSNLGIFAGILSLHIKDHLLDSGSISIKKLQSNLSISQNLQLPDSWSIHVIEGWTIYLNQPLLENMKKFRSAKLPNETGGILIGGIDHQYKKIYITSTIYSPSDSVERKTLYIRGIQGVQEELHKIEKITNHNLLYLGEWHTHPDNHHVNRSSDDNILFQELVAESKFRGNPALMLILGDHAHDYAIYLG